MVKLRELVGKEVNGKFYSQGASLLFTLIQKNSYLNLQIISSFGRYLSDRALRSNSSFCLPANLWDFHCNPYTGSELHDELITLYNDSAYPAYADTPGKETILDNLLHHCIFAMASLGFNVSHVKYVLELIFDYSWKQKNVQH